MSNASTPKKARQERRLRSSGFLQSPGIEPTTVVMFAAVTVLVFVFFSIVTSEGPASSDTDATAEPATITVPEEVLVLPR
ncbi:MAG: hypothetical protein HQ518_24425 [Rhodopirellula sp.]|nr:hypothetical protein [Rhodopirellula sp.]